MVVSLNPIWDCSKNVLLNIFFKSCKTLKAMPRNILELRLSKIITSAEFTKIVGVVPIHLLRYQFLSSPKVQKSNNARDRQVNEEVIMIS